jgi:hypothetical protein
VNHPQLIFGWSALLVILLMPMSDTLRSAAVGLLLVALSFIDLIRAVRESQED